MDSRVTKLVVRGLVLLALSMVLVFGFWEHRNFYQFGLPVLLLGGGLVTALVILAFRVALSGRLPHGFTSGEIAVTEAEEAMLRRSERGLLIRSAEGSDLPPVASTVRASGSAGRALGRIRILDGRRTYLRDVTEEEVRQAGYASVAEVFPRDVDRRPDHIVAILRVERLGGPHD